MVDSLLVFVTGRGGAGFHSSGPAPPPGWGGFFWHNPSPAPVRGLPALISWMGLHLSPPIFNGGLSGGWAGRRPRWGQGGGMSKNMPRPWPSSGAGRGKGPGAHVFRGPGVPVTNSIRYLERNRFSMASYGHRYCCRMGDWSYCTDFPSASRISFDVFFRVVLSLYLSQNPLSIKSLVAPESIIALIVTSR